MPSNISASACVLLWGPLQHDSVVLASPNSASCKCFPLQSRKCCTNQWSLVLPCQDAWKLPTKAVVVLPCAHLSRAGGACVRSQSPIHLTARILCVNSMEPNTSVWLSSCMPAVCTLLSQDAILLLALICRDAPNSTCGKSSAKVCSEVGSQRQLTIIVHATDWHRLSCLPGKLAACHAGLHWHEVVVVIIVCAGCCCTAILCCAWLTCCWRCTLTIHWQAASALMCTPEVHFCLQRHCSLLRTAWTACKCAFLIAFTHQFFPCFMWLVLRTANDSGGRQGQQGR